MQISKRFKQTGSDCELVARLIRAPLIPMLSVESGIPIIFSPFANPLSHEITSPDGEFRLGSRMVRPSQDISVTQKNDTRSSHYGNESCDIDEADSDRMSGPEIVLWAPDYEKDPKTWGPVLVDKMLSRVLRAHQVEGVKFIFNCLMGLDAPGQGCILADDMGLGKTLQSICVIWTLLTSNIKGLMQPAIKRALVLCPSSLVKNWASEFERWTKSRCKVVAVAESTRDKVLGELTHFRYSHESQVLVISYESFRIQSKFIRDYCNIDLIICDEAHRLKNDKTKLSQCIARMTSARKRLLLTGTPIQNDLSEFFAMVKLALPEQSTENFDKKYSIPINRARNPDAKNIEQSRGDAALAELSEFSSKFILRRTNLLLSKLLPKKHCLIVFCKLSQVQRDAYTATTEAVIANKKLALNAIMKLVKVCCPSGPPQGKMQVLKTLLINFNLCRDKCVIISCYTSCLDKVEQICKSLEMAFVRLDGTIGAKKRHQIVTDFNCPNSSKSVFLLSSKAGGCGINLIGANRLVMLDADWNPANDKQAMARVWREGQKKECWIYRLFSTGTIEEKVLQRQINKDGLFSSVVGAGALREGLSSADIRSLFELKPPDVISDTHNVIQCKQCSLLHARSSNEYVEDDLLSWDHLDSQQFHEAPLLQSQGCLSGTETAVSMIMYMEVDRP